MGFRRICKCMHKNYILGNNRYSSDCQHTEEFYYGLYNESDVIYVIPAGQNSSK